MNYNDTLLKNCTLCPRECHVDRTAGRTGFCKETAAIRAARAALHHWEEPCISGVHGSGAVFFSGCNLRCVFCQNYAISGGCSRGEASDCENSSGRFRGEASGKELTIEHLAEIFLFLQEKKANNINLVTPTHFTLQIAHALELARNQGLTIPVVYNTGSYEKVETLQMLDGLIDVYLPDLKYYSPAISRRYSFAPDYFKVASKAIAEMYRQVGAPVFMPEPDTPLQQTSDMDVSESMLMKRGMIVRHLLLPGCETDSLNIVKYLFDTYKNDIYISIMSQYTPMPQVKDIPALNCTVSRDAYDFLIDACIEMGMEQVFIQDGEAAEESFIPPFDHEGL